MADSYIKMICGVIRSCYVVDTSYKISSHVLIVTFDCLGYLK